jgi:hypothetical protein
MGGSGMLSNALAALLKLPANDRIELALALWASLTDAEREAEFELPRSRRRSSTGGSRSTSRTPVAPSSGKRCAGSSRVGRDAATCISTRGRGGAARCAKLV